jgi:anti-anti-sigma factor
MFFTHLLKNLPEVILAVIVIHAVSGLIKIKELKRIRELSRMEFNVALIAIGGVLVFGILKGVLISVIMSLVLLIRRSSRPEVAILGRIRDTRYFSDITRHPDNKIIPGFLITRIESSIFYFNAEDILEKIHAHLKTAGPDFRVLILDLAAVPYVDVSGSKMMLNLAKELQQKGIKIRIVDALSGVRDILRKQGLEEITGKISRSDSIEGVITENAETN